jgi:hypothetical protein
MKTRISTALLWIVALLFVAQNAQAQTAFEGRVIQTVSVPQMGDEKMEMTMNIKGEKMMINMDMGPMGAMKMFTLNGGKSMTMIMEQLKQGFEIDIPEDAAKTASATTAPAMKATGKKETINGYAAEEWIASIDENNTMTFWLTSDIDKSLVKAMQTAMKAQNAQSPNSNQAEIMKVMTEKGMIAVRTTVTNGGETAAVVDLVKIEKASIPDATFTVPADIKIQKMDPAMMNGGSPTN